MAGADVMSCPIFSSTVIRRTSAAARTSGRPRASGWNTSGASGRGARRQPGTSRATASVSAARARVTIASLQGDRGLGVDLFLAADHPGGPDLVLVPLDEPHVRRDCLPVELHDLLVGLDAHLGEVDLI